MHKAVFTVLLQYVSSLLALVHQCANCWLFSVVEIGDRYPQAGYCYSQRCESHLNQLYLQNLSLGAKRERKRNFDIYNCI